MFSFRLDPGANSGVGVVFTDRHDGFSSPGLGPLNLGRVDVDDANLVRANFASVRSTLGLGPVITLDQRHTPDVLVMDERQLASWGDPVRLGADAGEHPLPVADASVTALPGVALCIRVADCVPVLLADADRGVVGAAHAGRVGFATGVLANTVAAMRALGAADITAWIGPHVCGSCYEVPEQMADEVAAAHPAARSRTPQGTAALDLGAGCEAELVRLGALVERVDPCTLTTASLHSHRRDGAAAGRLAGLVWLQP